MRSEQGKGSVGPPRKNSIHGLGVWYWLQVRRRTDTIGLTQAIPKHSIINLVLWPVTNWSGRRQRHCVRGHWTACSDAPTEEPLITWPTS